MTLVGVPGVPLVQPGDDLPALVVEVLGTAALEPHAGDVVMVTSKIVSKAEGCTVDLRTIEPSARAIELAEITEKDPQLVELVLRESTEVVRAGAEHAARSPPPRVHVGQRCDRPVERRRQ